MILKARQGLVQKKVQVTRGGKTFTTTIYVRPGETTIKDKQGRTSKWEDIPRKERKIKLSVGKDINGNKIVKVKTPNGSFTIQTNQNLPYTHSNISSGGDYNKMIKEINAYVQKYGTKRQKKLLS